MWSAFTCYNRLMGPSQVVYRLGALGGHPMTELICQLLYLYMGRICIVYFYDCVCEWKAVSLRKSCIRSNNNSCGSLQSMLQNNSFRFDFILTYV